MILCEVLNIDYLTKKQLTEDPNYKKILSNKSVLSYLYGVYDES